MARLKRLVTGLVDRVDDRLDRIRYRAGRRVETAAIEPYLSFGTGESLRVSGRVLEMRNIRPLAETDTWRIHFRNMVRRLSTDEIPHATVRARLGETIVEDRADDEGYFHLDLAPSAPVDVTRVWHDVSLELIDPMPTVGPLPVTTCRVLVPPPTARFGVVSDIDDTVIWTNVTDKLRMAKIVFFDGVRARLPFEGVSALYRAFQNGAGGAEGNPIFYVSGSPWNLYDLLVEIFAHHGIPEGPIRLRDFGSSDESLLHEDTKRHKIDRIRGILDCYPSLPFLLVGDSGEQDPEIYRQIVGDYSARIPAVYIRNVTSDAARERAITALADEVRAAGSELVLARDSRFAAEHAASRGWIVPGALEPVEEAVATDKGSPSPAEVTPAADRPPEEVI